MSGIQWNSMGALKLGPLLRVALAAGEALIELPTGHVLHHEVQLLGFEGLRLRSPQSVAGSTGFAPLEI